MGQRALREGHSEYVRYSDQAARNADRLRRLVDDLLDVSRVTGGKIELETVGDRDEEKVIEKLLQNPKTEFVDARSVTRGCFTFRIRRA